MHYTAGTIEEITKRGGRFWADITFDSHTQTGEVLTVEEALKLEPGDIIKLEVEWNEDGWGMKTKIVRPIEKLVKSKEKYIKL